MSLWREIPYFVPNKRAYYEKQQGVAPERFRKTNNRLKPGQDRVSSFQKVQTINFNSTSATLSAENRLRKDGMVTKSLGVIPNRQRLSYLIQCLAIAETQKLELSNNLQEISRQKEEINMKLSHVLEEKTEFVKAKTDLDSTNKKLAEKMLEIEELKFKLKKLEEAESHINYQAPIESGIKPLQTSIQALEEKLAMIQTEISSLNIKMSSNNTIGQNSGLSSNLKTAISLPDETSSSYIDSSSKEPHDDAALVQLLKKLMSKAKKIHSKQEETSFYAPDRSKDQVTSTQEPASARNSGLADIEKLAKDIEISRSKRHNQQMISPMRKVTMVDETKTRNQSTSPPNSFYLSQDLKRETANKSLKSSGKKKIRKVKNADGGSNIFSSSCLCTTCSNTVSWICPDCVSSDYSSIANKPPSRAFIDKVIKEQPVASGSLNFVNNNKGKRATMAGDQSVLFGADTSMVKPLIEIVSEMDTIEDAFAANKAATLQPSFAFGEADMDGDMLEMITSLNGKSQ